MQDRWRKQATIRSGTVCRIPGVKDPSLPHLKIYRCAGHDSLSRRRNLRHDDAGGRTNLARTSLADPRPPLPHSAGRSSLRWFLRGNSGKSLELVSFVAVSECNGNVSPKIDPPSCSRRAGSLPSDLKRDCVHVCNSFLTGGCNRSGVATCNLGSVKSLDVVSRFAVWCNNLQL